jgi:microcystin-dependent protein
MAELYTDGNVTAITSPVKIPSTDYIGNSLATINTNYDTLYQDILFLQKQIAGIEKIPVGTIAFFATQLIPTGWLLCDGSLPTNMATLYPALYNLLGTTYGDKGRLPNLQGEFIRGWDKDRGIDPKRTVGSNQTDSVAKHTHPYKDMASNSSANYVRNAQGSGVTTQFDIVVRSEADVNRTTSNNTTGGTETRPRNIALLGCIKW